MPFAHLDAAAIARSLGQVADRPGDLSEVFLERLRETEVPADGEAPGIRVRSESGFAVRLVREGLTWLAARDGFEPEQFNHALRPGCSGMHQHLVQAALIELLFVRW